MVILLSGSAALTPCVASPPEDRVAPRTESEPVVVVSDEELARLLGDPRIDIGDGSGSTAADGLRWARLRMAHLRLRTIDPVHVPEVHTWDDILFETRDWKHRDIPTRWGGYTTFGFAKIESYHNLSNPAAIQAPYNGLPDKSDGTRHEYYGYALQGGRPRLTIVSVYDESIGSQYGDTPDRRPVGTITSYCDGLEQCPDWVNH